MSFKITSILLHFKHKKLAFFAIVLVAFSSCTSCDNQNSQCEGIQCEFFEELNDQFKETGLEKDQGYVFLKSHSVSDTTTQRIIVRSMSGIYYAYPSKEGWYAQKKDEDEKFTINELGHFLAEKEKLVKIQVDKLFNDAIINFVSYIKSSYASNSKQLIERNIKVIDTEVFNNLSFDKLFLAKELDSLSRGELTFYDFTTISKNEFLYIYRQPIGFYKKSVFYLMVPYYFQTTNNERKIRTNKVYTSLTFTTLDGPFIYVPQEKKWFAIDKFDEANKKYGILSLKKWSQ